MVLTAYVDESMRRRRGENVCFYVLAAVLVDDQDLDGVRDTLRGLRYGKSLELHWRDERPERLPLIAEAVAALPVSALVAVCMHGPCLTSERARRLSLGRLLQELSSEGVSRAVFDSRRDQLNGDEVGWRHLEAVIRIVDVDP